MSDHKPLFTQRGLNFSYYATTAILLPFLPIYFTQKGYSSGEIGLFMMIGPFVAVFVQPLWGYISDRYLSLTQTMFTLWALTVLSSVGLFYTQGFTATLLFVLLLYFFMLPAQPLLDSLSIRTAQQAGVSYGSVRLWGSIGFSVIAATAGFVIPLTGGVGHMHYLYWALWILPFVLLSRSKSTKSRGPSITLRSASALMRSRSFLWVLFMIFVVSVPHRMNDVMFGLYLKDLHAEDWMVSTGWALAAASEIPTFALINRFVHRFHELAILAVVSLLFAIRWLLYAFVTDVGVLMGMQALHCVTFAVFWIVAVQYVTRIVPDELRSTGQSLLSAVFMGLAGLTGGLVGGWLKDLWGGSGVYTAGAVLALIAAVLFIGTHVSERSGPPKRREWTV